MSRTGSRRRTTLLWSAVVACVLIASSAAGAVAQDWHTDHIEAGRFLPGTTIAGVDVGGSTSEQARAAVEHAAEDLLGRSVALTHDGERWETTAAALGAVAEIDAAFEAALDATETAALPGIVLARFAGTAAGGPLPLPMTLDEAAVDAFLDDAIADVARPAQDATVVYTDGEAVVEPHADGLAVDRDRVRGALVAALHGDAAEVALEPAVEPSAVVAADIEPHLAAIAEAAETALDRELTVTRGDRRWTVTPRELGAAADLDAVVGEALAQAAAHAAEQDALQRQPEVPQATPAAATADGQAPEPAPLSLELPAPALTVTPTALLDTVAAFAEEADVPAQDASIEHDSGWVELIAEQDGELVDRRAAARAIAAAIAQGAEEVDLPVRAVAAEVTTDAFEHVLLVRQDQRKVYLYVDGEITREWDVAIGAPGHRTPTGVFTVGLKRYLPTWYNPAPNGWGANMPATIGPGPSNPLGVRALNWLNADGHDTLIRFHGTTSLSSIGGEASKGCIRLRNPDVIELYDLVPEGTTIISTWG